MNETLLFSVIIPVYNAEEYLRTCVESVLTQSFRNFELLLVDDGSTDNSATICDEFAAVDSRVQAIHQPNSGHTLARNNGLIKSKGNYVVFLDSDDWLEPDTLAFCAEAIEEYHPTVVAFGWQEEHGDRVVKSQPFGEGFYDRKRLEKEIVPHLIMSADGTFFPRALWGKAMEKSSLMAYQLEIPQEIKTGEDMCCIVQMLFNAQSLFISPQNLYHYRVMEGSVSRRGDRQAVMRCLQLVHYLQEAEPGLKTTLRDQFYRLVVQQMYSACVRLCASKPKWGQLSREFRTLCQDSVCKSALKEARFTSKGRSLRIKQQILRFGVLLMVLAVACNRK